ncbi:hypothetical protein N1851_012502 [Merluccius polli]|uniref:Uncharacterized protein n=1 Tax=Merluccius polli TaxID=89951 RepID=A0AA47MXF0_MERPO|nr:hypothetical protein N1851_012502 [Merluccius polli]
MAARTDAAAPLCPENVVYTSHPQRKRRRRCARRQKRGKRGGIQARLAANPHKPALPSIVLANVRSLDNKLDELQLLRSSQRTVRECCVFVFTETWLNNIPDSAIQLDRLTCYRADRALINGGKTRGSSVCVYIRDAWCQDAVVVCRHCSPLAEFMIIKCRPFYLPREFSAILLVAVYIPPSGNNNDRDKAMSELYSAISDQQTAQPDGLLIVAGNNTLDLVYTTLRGAYKASPLPHLGASDHTTVMLMPAYRPKVKVTRLVQKQEYSDTVTAYISKCSDDVTVTKTITVRANQKPWLTGEVYGLLGARYAAFRAGDEAGLRSARANLNRGIRLAKRQYSSRISNHFNDSRDTRSLWKGIQTITDYKPRPQTCDSDNTLLNNLNNLFGRFEADNSTPAQKSPPPADDQGRGEPTGRVVQRQQSLSQRAPLTTNGAAVERVSSTKFLGLQHRITGRQSSAAPLLSPQTLKSESTCPHHVLLLPGNHESILTSCITVWYGGCTASCRRTLQRIVRAAEKIVGAPLPSLQDIYNTHLSRKAFSIAGDSTHPTHCLFSLLPSGRRMRSLKARTSRLKDSFIHQAVRMMNSLPALTPLLSLPFLSPPHTCTLLLFPTTMHSHFSSVLE